MIRIKFPEFESCATSIHPFSSVWASFPASWNSRFVVYVPKVNVEEILGNCHKYRSAYARRCLNGKKDGRYGFGALRESKEVNSIQKNNHNSAFCSNALDFV